jgi:spermidine synthase
VALGAATLAGQVLLLREILVVCAGNEIALGLTLFSWLLWTGLGSLAAGWWEKLRRERRRHRVGVGLVWLGALLVVALPAVRLFRLAAGWPLGILLSPGAMLLLTTAVLAGPCLVSGFVFVRLCRRSAEQWSGLGPGRAVGRVYALEAVGAGAAGLALHFIFLLWLRPLTVMVGLAVILSGAGLVAAWSAAGRWRLIPALAVGLVLLVLLPFSAHLDLSLRQLAARPLKVIVSTDTPYARLEATRYRDQITVYVGGEEMFSWPDRLSVERAVHPALAMHPRPRRVLVIGGAPGRIFTEILKHRAVRRIDYVQIDPGLIDLAQDVLPPTAGRTARDPRIQTHLTDARRFVRQTRSRYDVVLIRLPDPTTAQLNRYFTVEFYQRLRRVLAPRGLVTFTVRGGENIIGPSVARYLRNVRDTLATVFGDIVVFPGDQTRFFAAVGHKTLIRRPEVLLKRLRDRGIDAPAVSGYLSTDASLFKQDWWLSRIASAPSGPPNTDFSPRCFYYALTVETAQQSPVLAGVLTGLARVPVPAILAGLFGLGIVSWFLRRRWQRSWPLIALASIGFTEMTLQISLMLAFQILYGRMYQAVGLLIAAYMVGLAGGAAWMSGRVDTLARPRQALVAVQALGAGTCLVVLWAGLGLHHLQGLFGPDWWALFVLPGLALATGFLGGVHFPLTSRTYIPSRTEVGVGAGRLNAVDLAAAALGALLAGLVLIPVWGFIWTLIIAAILCLAVAVGGLGPEGPEQVGR